MGKYGRPPRVVALLENNPYPFDIRVRPQVEALIAAGYHVTVICPRERNEPWRESIDGVQVYRFPMPASGTGVANYLVEFCFATLAMTVAMLWVWARYGLDVLHIYAPPDSLFFAGLLPRLAGKIIIYDNRDLSPELYESKFGRADGVLYRLLLWLERRASRLATHVLVVNESYRRIIMERDGIPSDRVSAVRIGPELDRVRLTAPDPGLRARAKTIIAYLGQMAQQDGVDHLLQALRHLDQDFGHKDWFCVLIGPADEPQALEELAAQLGVSDRTWFTGYIPDEEMLRYLSTADICVDPDPANPLNNISTMVKLMEYMALGKPVVAYDLTEHRVTAGDAALYAQPNDELDMARQLMRLIEDPELRTRLAATGRERVERHLAWKHQRKRLLALYNALTQWRDASQPGEYGA
jgi:glycosyltransferase involved in cell wall biosynthesis